MAPTAATVPAPASDDNLANFGRSSLQPQLDLDLHPLEDSDDGHDRAVGDLLGAVVKGDITHVRKLAKKMVKEGKSLDEAVAAISLLGSKRYGPLHLAAAAGKEEVCKLLIKDFEVDMDATDVKGSCEVAELLLSNGAEVDPIWQNGGAPVHIAAENGHAGMLKLLLQHKADHDRLSPSLNTPLTASLIGSSLECMKILIEAGADVNDGSPAPLMVAARKGLTDCIKCLSEAGADANIPDENGKLPVEIAALQGSEECVKILFHCTTPLPEFVDWSIDGIIRHGKSVRQRQASKIKAEGDAAFAKKDYLLASSRYTKALDMDPADSTIYAKRSLCFQQMDDKVHALADANTFKDLHPDFDLASEEEDAMTLVEEYCKGIEAKMVGLNLGTGNQPADKASRTKGSKAAVAAAVAPLLRRSTRARQPNVRYSGPEWAKCDLQAGCVAPPSSILPASFRWWKRSKLRRYDILVPV